MFFFYTVIAVILTLSITPLSAQAGIFDWFKTASTVAAPIHDDVYEKPDNSQTVHLLQAAVNPDPNPIKSKNDVALASGEALINETGPIGSAADLTDAPVSDQISVYEVRKGDTLPSIAKMFGVTVNTILWANDIDGSIKPGDSLTILPISGIKYVIKKGDTVESIAKKYKADKKEIVTFNELGDGTNLVTGTEILIPDAEVELVKPAPIKSKKIVVGTNPLRGATNVPDYPGYYIRPIIGGVETQGLHGYNAVDLAAPTGTPIYASAAGRVIVAKSSGWNGGYGSYVVILHDNGTQTVYGHMSKVFVNQGDQVDQSQPIGQIGMTGKATGPHVHFEIRGAKNPF